MHNYWSRPNVNRFRLAGILLAATLIAAGLFPLIGCGGGSSQRGLPRTVVTVSITPATSSVIVGQSQSLSAAVQNSANTAVTWSVLEGASGGSVTSAGVYTAPMVAGTYHVVATSQADPTASGMATMTVTAPVPTITSVAPTAAIEGQEYSYTLSATDPVNTAIVFSLVTAPAGAQIQGNVVTWTPTRAQSRVVNSFEVRAATAAGGVTSQLFSVTPAGTVHGAAIDNYATVSGSVARPADLTSTYFGAVVRSGSAWTTIEANTHDDGTFDIPTVPGGKYYLVTPVGSYWTSASDVDLGADYLGRPDAVLPQNPTTFAVELSGLSPWTDASYLSFFNPNLNQSFLWSAGQTGDEGAAFSWNWTGPLSNATAGDQWFAVQALTKSVNGTAFEYLGKAAPVFSVTQDDGSTIPLAATMADLPQASLALKILGSQFAAQTFSINPAAQPHSTEIELDVQPFTAAKGSIGYTLLLSRPDQHPIITDVDFGSISYGNPFPSTWTPFLNVEYEVNVAYTAAGAATPVSVQGEVCVSTTQLPAAGTGVGPLVGPVLNIKLDGLDLTQPQTATTLTPTITWDAPALGTPTRYRLTIYQLSNTGGGSQYQNVLDLYSVNRTLSIPAGVLTRGAEYFFVVRAYYAPGADLTTSPYRLSFPWAYADALTAVVSLPASGL